MRYLSLLLLFLACLPATACDRPLRVYVGDWPPYMQVTTASPDAGLHVEGIDARILKAVMRHAQCEFNWVVMPVARAHNELRRGNIDLMMAASRIAERESYAWFSTPYREEVIELVGRLDAGGFVNWQQLVHQDLRIMAPRTGWYGEAYDSVRAELLAAGRLVFMEDYLAGVAMLKTGRVDLILGDRNALRHAAMDVGVVLSYPVLPPHVAPVHFMYSRQGVSRTTVDKLDASITALRASGLLDRLQVDTLP